MANGPLPELLRDLGIETLLDDPETLHRMAEVALDRAGLAANGRAPEEYRLEVELFEWCTMRLALLTAFCTLQLPRPHGTNLVCDDLSQLLARVKHARLHRRGLDADNLRGFV
jgi:hypothetical protein